MLRFKKIGTVIISVLLCMTTTSCGKEKESDPTALQTPQYSIGESSQSAPPSEEEIHTSDQGVKVIMPAVISAASVAADTETTVSQTKISGTITPEMVWAEDAVVTYNAFTLPEKAAFDDGSVGILSIPKIGLNVKVYESDDQMEDMDKGAAHFKSTSAWDGNVGLSGHNRTVSGYGAYFQDIYKLSVGDTLVYKTALGEREYRVTTVKTIGEEDWSCLSRSAENKLTLITCVNNNASKRLAVQAVQI